MDIKKFYTQLKVDKSIADKLKFNPYYQVICSGLSGKVKIAEKEFINLAANNYLGLAGDQRVKNAMIKAIEQYGTSMCGTPIATGFTKGFNNLEQKFANFTGLEAAIIFPSGYQANMALFSAIVSKEDLIIVDHYAHASLIHGIKNVGCKIKPFLHNNVKHLQGILEKSSNFRQIFVVSESVFSTEGSIAPFGQITELCKKYNAISVIDDSHGIGVLGQKGKGILEAENIVNFQGIYTASLGKALANAGGIIAGKKELIDFLKYSCPGLIYSTALPPAIIGGINSVITIINDEFSQISKKMWDNKNKIENCLIKNGFKLSKGKAPIISIQTGSLKNTVIAAKSFYENGILTTPFVEPSVPPNDGKIRLIAGADLQEHEIEYVLEAIPKIISELSKTANLNILQSQVQ
ncbi:MAG: pyridoxal phosphate-dependent aminotransferase family protein [Calditrichia bacterium]|nr:pyridoxal phosphate-dependent aminotransferase family protein [Calditrichia bacterium]